MMTRRPKAKDTSKHCACTLGGVELIERGEGSVGGQQM